MHALGVLTAHSYARTLPGGQSVDVAMFKMTGNNIFGHELPSCILLVIKGPPVFIIKVMSQVWIQHPNGMSYSNMYICENLSKIVIQKKCSEVVSLVLN